MPPVDPDTLPNTQPNVGTQVNVAADSGIFAGLGQYKQLVAFGFAGIAAFLLIYFSRELVSQGHADRVEDRAMFRESVRDIQREADRRAGEIKGAIDKNTEVFRQWIEESRASRKSLGQAPRTPESMPKPIAPQ